MLQSLTIGLIVALVGYFLQRKAWAHNKREEIRQREFEECMRLIEDLSKAVDRRLSALEEFTSELRKESVSEDSFNKYKESVFSWMHNFSTFKSKIFHYFGREMMLSFENNLHRSLQEVSSIALRTHRYGLDNLSKEHFAEYDNITSRISLARRISFQYLGELNSRVANEEIGRTSLYNNIHAASLDLISRTYLIQRLLGLKK